MPVDRVRNRAGSVGQRVRRLLWPQPLLARRRQHRQRRREHALCKREDTKCAVLKNALGVQLTRIRQLTPGLNAMSSEGRLEQVLEGSGGGGGCRVKRVAISAVLPAASA